MAIREGSIVTRKSALTKEIPCLGHLYDETEHDVRLDVCVGMVIEDIPGESEVIVNWLQMCPYAIKTGQIAQEGTLVDLLTEIGQIIPE